MEIEATGVAIRAATDEERLAYRRDRLGIEFQGSLVEPTVAGEGLYVVATAFVEFDGTRWESGSWHGHTVPLDRDATTDLLAVAHEIGQDGLLDLLGDMGIADMPATRWALFSAPHRIELDPALAERLSLR